MDPDIKGLSTHAEGGLTEAIGSFSHAEGASTAHAEFSHAEGGNTKAIKFGSHAEGTSNISSGEYSHAEGESTDTNGFTGAHIMGTTGKADADHSWFLANGNNDDNTGHNLAAKIIGSGPNNGRGFADIAWIGGGADFAEMFETVEGQPIDVGYFVTLDGDKIRKANSADNYILGITSSNPSFLADSGELRWKNKFLMDKWGRLQFHDIVIPAVTDQEGNVMTPKRIEVRPVVNPEYDPTREYISRLDRPEWRAVGLIGFCCKV
ncbi:hypothetical protein BK708_18455 [Bacillus thuringiensis serovar yunnanensis]|nr:hypothetical protein BK708_18455 [Bacillus thuringiensis serovar yunnanensis]